MEKVNSMQEQMGSKIRQMETLRRNKKEIQKILQQKQIKKMPFMGIFTLDTAKKNQ